MDTQSDPPHAHEPQRPPSWNILVTVREGFRDAKRVLKKFGTVERTHFFNVMVMEVSNADDFLHDFADYYRRHPFVQDCVSRLVPLKRSFTFTARDEFESKARSIMDEWMDLLEGKSFHVRMHRRGLKEDLSKLDEEQFLDRHIMDALKTRGTGATIDFTDPDFIIDVETLGNVAGLSIWSRDDLHAYPFLNLD